MLGGTAPCTLLPVLGMMKPPSWMLSLLLKNDQNNPGEQVDDKLMNTTFSFRLRLGKKLIIGQMSNKEGSVPPAASEPSAILFC